MTSEFLAQSKTSRVIATAAFKHLSILRGGVHDRRRNRQVANCIRWHTPPQLAIFSLRHRSETTTCASGFNCLQSVRLFVASCGKAGGGSVGCRDVHTAGASRALLPIREIAICNPGSVRVWHWLVNDHYYSECFHTIGGRANCNRWPSNHPKNRLLLIALPHGNVYSLNSHTVCVLPTKIPDDYPSILNPIRSST